MRPILKAGGGLILFLITWQLLASNINNIIIPRPDETLALLLSQLIEPKILMAALQTAWKVALAIALVMVLGIVTGLLLGLSHTLYDMFRPLIMVIQAVPVISWLSIVIFAWGVGWKGPVFIAFLSLLPISILTTVSGVNNLDRNLLEMARVYQVPFSRVVKHIYLGSLIPFIIAIIDVTIGQAWKVILVAEYLAGGSGLGVEIFYQRMNFNPPGVWALTFIAVLLGIATERMVKYAVRRLSVRWGPA